MTKLFTHVKPLSLNPPFFHVLFVGILLSFASQASFAGWPLSDSEGRELPSLAPLLKKVNPAVVNISVTQTQKQAQNPLLNDPFFRHFFNIPEGYTQPERKARSAGSGVIINADKGTVITNHHVIENADEVLVVLNDGRSFDAEVIGKDPDVDIAILKIEADDLAELPLANSDEVEVGDFVVAIGNPFGLGQTVTTGVVSALGRSGLGVGYENFIQTDASINPGNSGGALVNLRGALVGVNTAIIAPSGGNVGIGFAIPTNMAKSSMDQILEHGEVRRGQLGVFIQDLTPELAEAFDLDKHQQGVVIAKVAEESSAEDAGVKEGDIVIAVNGKMITRSAELRNQIGMRRVGDKIKLTVLRNGDKKTIKVKIGKGADSEEKNTSLDEPKTSDIKKLAGVLLRDTPKDEGVLVANLKPNSLAAMSGLRRGDIITGANKARVRDLESLRQATKRDDRRLLLRINRRGAALFIVIR